MRRARLVASASAAIRLPVYDFSSSSARLSSSTLTRGSPSRPKVRPCDLAVDQRRGRAPPAGRAPWRPAAPGKSAASGEMSGSRPLPEVVTRSTGTAADGFSCLELVDVALDAIGQRLAGRAEIGAAGVRGVVGRVDGLGRILRVRRVGRRRPAMEILVVGEHLADQRRADDLAVLLDQAALRLARERPPRRCR